MTVEERLTLIEKELAELKRKLPSSKRGWIARISGSFKDDPDFGEILRLGREIRDAEGPEDAEGDV